MIALVNIFYKGSSFASLRVYFPNYLAVVLIFKTRKCLVKQPCHSINHVLITVEPFITVFYRSVIKKKTDKFMTKSMSDLVRFSFIGEGVARSHLDLIHPI